MTDLIKSDWKELDADNVNPSPNGVQVGYAPSTVAPILRTIRGALKRFYVQSNAAYSTTGTGAAYALTYAVAPEGYSTGIIYRFFAHTDNTGAATLNINLLGAKSILSQHGEPLTAGKIKAGKVIEVVYNGTSFELISNEVHNSKFTGNTSLANLSVSGNTSLLGSTSLSTTLIDNATITSLSVGAGTAAVDGTIVTTLNTDRPWYIRQRGADGTATLSFENTTDKSIGFSSEATYAGPKIILTPTATPSITIGGNTVWHAGNDGAGSGLDADLLDGQHGAYYLNLANATGTLSDGNLPSTMSAKTFTGTITLPGTGTNGITAGTGDSATYATYNFALKGWNGMGLVNNTDGTVTGYYDFRNGKLDTKGGFFKNGTSVVYNDGGNYGISITGRAYPMRVGGVAMNFNWNGQSGQPGWLWGGEDGTNMYVYNPSNFSVAYAANAGALDGLTTPGAVVSSGMAALGVGAIGTYAFLWNEVNEIVDPGQTRPGSQLTYANGNTQAAGTSPAGTWRLMGDTTTGSTTPRLSVWMRIS